MNTRGMHVSNVWTDMMQLIKVREEVSGRQGRPGRARKGSRLCLVPTTGSIALGDLMEDPMFAAEFSDRDDGADEE